MSLRAAVRVLLAQARERQTENAGLRGEDAMLQHLVGARLEIVMGAGVIKHHAVAEADQAEGRAGDFTPGDVAIHVTTNAGDAVMARCLDILMAGLRPLVITLPARTAAADQAADAAGIAQRVDILDIEQFLATNLHERVLFQKSGQRPRFTELSARYNELIDPHENDPSLRIEISG